MAPVQIQDRYELIYELMTSDAQEWALFPQNIIKNLKRNYHTSRYGALVANAPRFSKPHPRKVRILSSFTTKGILALGHGDRLKAAGSRHQRLDS